MCARAHTHAHKQTHTHTHTSKVRLKCGSYGRHQRFRRPSASKAGDRSERARAGRRGARPARVRSEARVFSSRRGEHRRGRSQPPRLFVRPYVRTSVGPSFCLFGFAADHVWEKNHYFSPALSLPPLSLSFARSLACNYLIHLMSPYHIRAAPCHQSLCSRRPPGDRTGKTYFLRAASGPAAVCVTVVVESSFFFRSAVRPSPAPARVIALDFWEGGPGRGLAARSAGAGAWATLPLPLPGAKLKGLKRQAVGGARPRSATADETSSKEGGYGRPDGSERCREIILRRRARACESTRIIYSRVFVVNQRTVSLAALALICRSNLTRNLLLNADIKGIFSVRLLCLLLFLYSSLPLQYYHEIRTCCLVKL